MLDQNRVLFSGRFHGSDAFRNVTTTHVINSAGSSDVFVAVLSTDGSFPTSVDSHISHRQHPNTVNLGQNYPNPFNPVTTVEFSILKSEVAILKVCDLLGRELATLVNEVKEPGTHTVQWDASGVASGIYFYRLTAGSFAETKKAILTR
jgi:hypothetical protein